MQNIFAFCFVLFCFVSHDPYATINSPEAARLVQNAIRTFEQCLPGSGRQVTSDTSQTARFQHNF